MGGVGISVWSLVPDIVWVALICSVPVVAGFVPWGLRLKRRHADAAVVDCADTAVVDYMMACDIANRYIDPDLTMPGGRRIAVRSQILARFEQVGGAMVGENYNGQLLHQWLQANAARALVGHQDEIV